jgi:predicted metal-binding membrane protein
MVMSVHPNTLIERALRRGRVILVGALALVTLACWTWIVPMARDMYGPMSGPSAWMMTPKWDASHVLRLLAMWIVMMAGMMLPSASPLLLIYAAGARQRPRINTDEQPRKNTDSHGTAVYAMAAGYLLVWVGFSVLAAALQRALGSLLILTPMMELRSARLSGALLVLAGIYQLTPLKRACLASCASPQTFLMLHWREGRAGAFRMGLRHGIHCIGCCWALMLLLFAGGVMNLAVIGALTALVLVEKLTPVGPRSVRATGILLIAAGSWLALR